MRVPRSRFRLSEKVPWPYNRPFPFHRLVFRRTQRSLPFGAGVVVVNTDGVGYLKVAVDCAVEAALALAICRLGKRGPWLRLTALHINVDPLTKIGPPLSAPKLREEDSQWQQSTDRQRSL
jgi:hypothetical protein